MEELTGLKENSSSTSSGPEAQATGPLGELTRKIDDLSSNTEEQFLSIGLQIQEYSEKASSITGSALNASRIISGDDLNIAIEGLAGMVDQLENIFHRVDSFSDSNLENLQTIGDTIRSVEKELGGLGDTSRDLKMLALSTKIQSTQTGGDTRAFMQLGKDIGKMSETISSKAKELHSETAGLFSFVRNVHESLHELQGKQRYQTGSVLEWTRSIIVSMNEMSTRSKKEGDRIRAGIDHISRNVNDMVTSMQYQDITRQSLQKVVDELRHMGDSEGDPFGDSSDPSSPFTGVPKEIIVTGHCLQQKDHFEKAGALIDEALEAISRSLENIAASINDMVTVTRVVKRDSSGFLVDLETAVSSVTSFLKEVVQSNREMSDSMNSLGSTVASMSEFTQDIEMISSEVELISLNARIMAAQAGVNGVGMGVISDAVKETAKASDNQRVSVVSRLNEISSASAQLQGELQSTTTSDEAKLDQLMRELGVFLDALRTMQRKIVALLTEIDGQSAELVDGIGTSIQNVRGYIDSARSSEVIARDLEELALSFIGQVKPEDLVSIAAEGSSVNDLMDLDQLESLQLVEKFFGRYSSQAPARADQAAGSGDDEIVLFESDL